MSAPVVLDTNVLIYAEDSADPIKRQRARSVIHEVLRSRSGVLTAQVIGEYWSTVTRRFSHELTAEEAQGRLEMYCSRMRVVPVDVAVVKAAVRGARRYVMHYYDAQVWAAARIAGVGVVLSEDLNPGPEIEGVRFMDPFVEGFDLMAVLLD
jgi:predicted nucleic acid-binding protein